MTRGAGFLRLDTVMHKRTSESKWEKKAWRDEAAHILQLESFICKGMSKGRTVSTGNKKSRVFGPVGNFC